MQLGAIHRPAPAAIVQLRQRARLDLMQAPPSADWFAKCPADGDYLGNDLHGNCVPVADYRIIQIRRMNVFGDRWKPTTAMTLDRYAKLTGFNPITCLPDDGTDTAADMTDWCTKGIQVNAQDIDVSLWTAINPNDVQHVKIGVAHIGPLAVTLALPLAFQDLKRWASVPGFGVDWAAASWGFHRVVLGKYDGDVFTLRTWGQDLELHPAAWRSYVVAVDAPLSRVSWLDPTGLSPSGLDWDALHSDMLKLAA